MKRSTEVYQDVVKAIACHVGYDGIVKALRVVVQKRNDLDTVSKDHLVRVFDKAIQGINNVGEGGK